MKTFLAFALTALFAHQTQAAQFKYNELMLKDYDEMLQMVNSKLKKARAVEDNDQEAVEHLREAVKLILSRPDSDNMVAKLIPEIRKELTGYNAFDDVLSALAAEEITIVKDKQAAGSVKATSLFVLTNMISLIKPEAVNNNDLRRVLDRIRSADIEITDSVKHDIKLRGMFNTPNPSKTAKEVLKNLPPLKTKEDKAKPTADE